MGKKFLDNIYVLPIFLDFFFQKNNSNKENGHERAFS